MTDSPLLKHQLGTVAIEQIAISLKSADERFDAEAFIRSASAGLDELELKQRVEHIVCVLGQYLPSDFVKTAELLKAVVKHWPLPEQRHNWHSFAAWPLIDYVKVYGLDSPSLSLQVLETLTQLFTAEFAIRPFLQHNFELTYQQMLLWCEHEDEHVRRLASEGIRPRLPWAEQLVMLKQDPAPIWPILDRLKTDSSAYVRRSVANNLNDISKDHPEQVLAICRQWLQMPHPHSEWIIRHGLRTLVKSGYSPVYPLLGYSAEPQFKRVSLALDQTKIKLGEALGFCLELETGTASQRVILDYQVAFVKADGRLSRKVFKWKNLALPENSILTLENGHVFKALSTRKLYPGQHWIECLINGQVQARAAFELSLD